MLGCFGVIQRQRSQIKNRKSLARRSQSSTLRLPRFFDVSGMSREWAMSDKREFDRAEREPDDEDVGDFGEGQEQEEHDQRPRRFSEGQETEGAVPEKERVGDFGEGQEEGHHHHEGTFAEGQRDSDDA